MEEFYHATADVLYSPHGPQSIIIGTAPHRAGRLPRRPGSGGKVQGRIDAPSRSSEVSSTTTKPANEEATKVIRANQAGGAGLTFPESSILLPFVDQILHFAGALVDCGFDDAIVERPGVAVVFDGDRGISRARNPHGQSQKHKREGENAARGKASNNFHCGIQIVRVLFPAIEQPKRRREAGSRSGLVI